jgi:hypothetical protein
MFCCGLRLMGDWIDGGTVVRICPKSI